MKWQAQTRIFANADANAVHLAVNRLHTEFDPDVPIEGAVALGAIIDALPGMILDSGLSGPLCNYPLAHGVHIQVSGNANAEYIPGPDGFDGITVTISRIPDE